MRADIVDAMAGLLSRVTAGEPALSVVAEELSSLGELIGVERIVVALDDPRLGRQVFTSDRRPLGDLGQGIFGPAMVATEPADIVDLSASALMLAAVGAALHTAQFPTPSDEFERALHAAVSRAARFGWSCTLVLVELIEPDKPSDRTGHAREPKSAESEAARLSALVRAGEFAGRIGHSEIGLLLEHVASEAVPEILHRIAREARLGRIVFGLAVSPADGIEVETLVATARSRLATAREGI